MSKPTWSNAALAFDHVGFFRFPRRGPVAFGGVHGRDVPGRPPGTGVRSLAWAVPFATHRPAVSFLRKESNVGQVSLQPALPLRVLVVDDYDDARDSLCMLLRIWGCHAEPASDGPQALAAALTFRPHVVLMELALPGMDGYEAARRLQELPQPPLLVAVTTCAGRRPPENVPRGVRRALGQARGHDGPAGAARPGGGAVSPGEGGAVGGRPRRRGKEAGRTDLEVADGRWP